MCSKAICNTSTSAALDNCKEVSRAHAMPVVTPIPGSSPLLSAQPAPSLAEIRPAMLSTVLDVGLNSTPSLGLQSPTVGWKRCRSGAVLEECRVGGSSRDRHWPPGVLSHRAQERPAHAAEGAPAAHALGVAEERTIE